MARAFGYDTKRARVLQGSGSRYNVFLCPEIVLDTVAVDQDFECWIYDPFVVIMIREWAILFSDSLSNLAQE